jgi:hypothetical protein
LNQQRPSQKGTKNKVGGSMRVEPTKAKPKRNKKTKLEVQKPYLAGVGMSATVPNCQSP